MENYDMLLHWLREANLSVTELEGEYSCYTRLKSKHYEGMDYSLFLSLQDDESLIFDLAVMAPPVERERTLVVQHYLDVLNSQPDPLFEWWMNDVGEIYLLCARKFDELVQKTGKLPVFYYVLDYMVDEVDMRYHELIDMIVGPAKKSEGPNAMMKFMKEIVVSPERHINLDREEVAWLADRFRGRLYGYVWALLDDRTDGEIQLPETYDNSQLLACAQSVSSPEEAAALESLVENINARPSLQGHHHADYEYGKWEGVAAYFHQLPLDALYALEDIDVNA